MLLREVRVVPVDGGAIGEPVDILIEDGLIRQVAPAVSSEALSSEALASGTPVVEGDGRWLIPGLWDAHVHLGQWALASRRLDLSRTSSPEGVLALVGRAVRESPGRPVIGTGQRAGTWGRQVTVAELDAACAAVPVVLINSDFHHAWLNTAALDALGLARRDGMVAEAEWFAAYPRVARLEEPATHADYRRVLGAAAAKGVTGLVDFEFGAPWSDWAQRWHQGCDLLRVRWSPYADQLGSVREGGLPSGVPLSTGSALPEADERLTVGSLKIISDGSLGTRTAWCCEPYADTAGYGAPNLSGEELGALLAEGRGRGLSVATHAIGDRALEAALAAYAATGARGSIEHAQLTTSHAIIEMAQMGLVASVQPAHLLDDHETTDRVWADRAGRCFTFRSMLDHGVEVALGSDAPVAPLDPWLAIAAAVHRGQPGDEPWHPEQAITVAEAIAASAGGSRIAAGQPGDLALLDSDPLASDAAALRAMHVALTCVAGKVVHSTLELSPPVQLRTAVGQVGRPGRLSGDVRDEQLLVAGGGLGEYLAGRAADHAQPAVGEHAIRATVVGVDDTAAVLAGPRPHQELLHLLIPGHVRGRHQHGTGPVDGQVPDRLRELDVIADEQAHLGIGEGERRRSRFAREEELFVQVAEEVHLAVPPRDDAVGADERRRVVRAAIRGALGVPVGDRDLVPARDLGDGGLGRPAGVLGEAQHVVEGDAISGGEHLRRHQHLGPLGGGAGAGAVEPAQVRGDVEWLRLALPGGYAHGVSLPARQGRDRPSDRPGPGCPDDRTRRSGS
jgi:predicted amidohydrolase YtcJ